MYQQRAIFRYLIVHQSAKILEQDHRAGLGLSEVTDSIIIIVSEETGSVSVAREGKLIRYADAGNS